MKKLKVTTKRHCPSNKRKFDTDTLVRDRFFERQVKFQHSETKTLNNQVKKLTEANEEFYKSTLVQLDSLKKENQLIIEHIKALDKKQASYIEQENKNIQDLKSLTFNWLDALEKNNKEILQNFRKVSESKASQGIEADLIEIRKQSENILAKLQDGRKHLDRISGSVQESVWAHIFNSTLKPEDRRNQAYSPGRWAVSYPCLYAMYRILGSFCPQNILELGLGQSTVMIGDYVAKNPGVAHTVVERSPEWVEFFKKENKLSVRTHIKVLDHDFVEYGGEGGIRTF